MLPKKQWRHFLHQLRQWHQPRERKLPWKGVKDAYLVWVSEVFLQQTQADRVVEFYLRFTSRFPTVESLAKSSFEEALPYFKGLGYYRRLRNMIETAKIVANDHAGKFPRTVEELRQLPGVGEYTARAIASFAFGKKVLAPDTNVKRIVERYFNLSLRAKPKAKRSNLVLGEQKTRLLRRYAPRNDIVFFDDHYPDDFNLNQALMDLGATICLAREPKCNICPLHKHCRYLKNPPDPLTPLQGGTGHPLSRGLGGPKSKGRNYQKVVVGILIQDKRVLVSRRKPDQTYSGLLEFPGGKVEAGEDERAAMQREFREEVGVEVSVRPRFKKLVQQKKKQVLSFHRCRILTGEARSMEGQEVFWVDQKDLNPKEFLPANKKIIEDLKKSRL